MPAEDPAGTAIIEPFPGSATDDLPPPAGKVPFSHDFRSPAPLSSHQLRQIRLRHDDFARSLATRLSIYLRLDFTAKVTSVSTVRYRTWLDHLPAPTHLTLFQMEGLDGIGLLQFDPRFALTIIDRLLGGTGAATQTSRDLTEIEVALTADIILLILREWGQQILPNRESRPTLTAHETNARFLQSSPDETTLFIVEFETGLNEALDRFALALPLPMVEPVLRRIAPVPEPRKSASSPVPAALRWNPELEQVPVSLTAKWPGFEVSARQLAGLRVGDLLPIDPESVQRVEVRLANVAKFTGRLGTLGPARAIELRSRISP